MTTADHTAPSPSLESEAILPLDVVAGRRAARNRRLPLMGADALAVLVAQSAALGVTASLFREQRSEMWMLGVGALWITGLWLIVFAAYGHYGNRRARISSGSFETTLRDAFHPLVVAGFMTLVIGFSFDAAVPGLFEPETVAVAVALALVLVPAGRVSLRSALPGLFRPERTLIVGSGEVARLVHDKLSRHASYGIELV
ncbi:MAG: hypothetical protein AB7G65_20215, partial [Thermoleophilia bacterium]